MKSCPVRLESNGDYWVAAWSDDKGQRRRKSLGAKSKLGKRAALKVCADLAVKMSVHPGSCSGGRAPALGAWLDRYYGLREGEIKPGTMTLHKETGSRLLSHFGESTRLDKITREHAADWRAAMANGGLKDPTVCRHVRTAKTMFNKAVELDLIVVNPFDRLRGTPPAPDRDWPIIADADLWELVGASRTWGWAALVGLAGWAGLRRSEALALRWEDVDWNGGRILVRNPDGVRGAKKHSRECLLEPDLRWLLELCYWRARGARVCPVPSNNLHRDMVTIIIKAGFDPWPKPFHTLRKSRATLWAMKYPAFVVDAWIGNSMEVAAKHYRRVPDEYYLPQSCPSSD